ncbi:MAG TPA: hypothetical protein VFU32_02620, partial [Ktedonobacterales bacterium]|nr:hypothetical protein [Ktedonobacterales bacterium]
WIQCCVRSAAVPAAKRCASWNGISWSHHSNRQTMAAGTAALRSLLSNVWQAGRQPGRLLAQAD